jgi:hypothetical protein
MANILGSLLVELGINSANFHGGLDKATYAAKQFAGDLRSNFSQLSGVVSQLGSTFGASFSPVSGILNSVMSGAEGVSRSFSAMGAGAPALLGLAGAAAGLGIATVGAAAGIAALGIAGGSYIEELDLMSQKTGVAVRDLQTLQAAGAAVNVPLESIQMGFRRFSRALADSSDESKRTTIVLHNLGVTSHDPYEAFLQLADGLSKVEDPNKRAAEATALLGQRIAQGLLPVLKEGRSGIEAYAKQVDELGGYIGPEQIEAQKKYKDSVGEIAIAWNRVKIESSAVLPYLATASKWMAEGIAHPFGIGFGEVKGPSAEEKQKQDAQKASLQLAADQTAEAEKEYQIAKARGPAGYELVRVQEEIKSALEEQTAEGYKHAAQLEARLPMLQKEAAEEKRILETLSDIDKRNKADFTHKKDVYGFEVSVRRDKEAAEQRAKIAENEADKEQRLLEEIDNTFKKDAEHQIAENKKVADSTDALREERIRMAADMKKSGIEAEAQLGIISKKEEQRQLLAILEQELADAKRIADDKRRAAEAALFDAVEAQKAAGGYNDITGQSSNAEANKAVEQAQLQYNTAVRQGETEVDRLTAAIMRESAAVKQNPFTDFIKSTQDVGTQMQKSIAGGLDGVAKGFAKTAVEGKSFALQMREVGKNIAESFIEMEGKRLIAHLLTEVGITSATATGTATREAVEKQAAMSSIMKSAKSAAAKAWDAGENFPFPLDLVMPPILAAGAFAGVMAFSSFDQGGIVGHTGMAKVHEQEMVLPRPISEKVQKMADPDTAKGGLNGLNVTYSPTVHAIDGKGVGDLLNAHGQLFTQHFFKELRRRNMV